MSVGWERNQAGRTVDARGAQKCQRLTTSVLNSSGTEHQRTCCFCKSNDHSSEKCMSDMAMKKEKYVLACEGRCCRSTAKSRRASTYRRQVSCTNSKRHHASSLGFGPPANTVPEPENIQTERYFFFRLK